MTRERLKVLKEKMKFQSISILEFSRVLGHSAILTSDMLYYRKKVTDDLLIRMEEVVEYLIGNKVR